MATKSPAVQDGDESPTVDEEDVRGEKVEATASEMQRDGEEESMASVEGLKAAPMAEPAEAVS